MKEIDTHLDIMNQIQSDYQHYVKYCEQHNITPLELMDWIHSDTPCTEPLHNHHDGCPVCDMLY